MRILTSGSILLALLQVVACHKTSEASDDDSKLTSVSVGRPDANTFPANFPQDKLRTITVDVEAEKPQSSLCRNQTFTPFSVDYNAAAGNTIEVKVYQACSYRIFMKLIGEKPEDVYYEGHAVLESASLVNKPSVSLTIVLNATVAGIKAGFGQADGSQSSIIVTGNAPSGREETDVTVKPEIGKERCNVTRLITADQKATLVGATIGNQKELTVSTKLRFLNDGENAAISSVADDFEKECGSIFTNLATCEVAFKVDVLDSAGATTETLLRTVISEGLHLDQPVNVIKYFPLKNIYEGARVEIGIKFCMVQN